MKNGESCDFVRDGNGYCLLEAHCWAEKPCPRSKAEADQAWSDLVDGYAARGRAARAGWMKRSEAP